MTDLITLIRQTYRRWVTDGVPASGAWNPPKDDIIDVLIQMSRAKEFASVLDYMTPTQLADVEAGTMLIDCGPAFNDAIADGKPLFWPGLRFLIDTPIEIEDGMNVFSYGAVLKTSDPTGVILQGVSKTAWQIGGRLNLLGTVADGVALTAGGRNPADTFVQKGFYLDSCYDFDVELVQAKDFHGPAIHISADAGTVPGSKPYGHRGAWGRVRTINSEYGLLIDDGPGAEYVTWNHLDLFACHIGMNVAAGNNEMLGGTIGANDIGIELRAGSNHLHGIIANMQINHNLVSIDAENIENGQTFTGCHIYQGPIRLDGSHDIFFDGGKIDVTDISAITLGGPAPGPNYFRDVHFPGTYTNLGSGGSYNLLQFLRCTGPGLDKLATGTPAVSPNTDMPFEATVRREPAFGTQSVTSGVAATVVMNRNLQNHSLAYDVGTGLYTCIEGGEYAVEVDIIAGGTAMSTTASFIDVQTSTAAAPTTFTSTSLITPTVYTTTKLVFTKTVRVRMEAGAVIRLRATITGTTPVIGDAGYNSTLSIRKVG
jgi:hypothetical protein